MAESDLIRGNVDTVILKVLYDGDRYGYDIIKQINARSDGQWEIKQPTVYAALKRLEKQGFVSSYWDASESNGGRRKYFSLTDEGRKVFITYKNEWERTRDLFGDLITDDDPIFPVDDFSDVEEDSYQLPKRRATRKREKPAAKAEPERETASADIQDDNTYNDSDPTAQNRFDTAIAEDNADTVTASDLYETENISYSQPVGDYVQASFFDQSPAYDDIPSEDAYSEESESISPPLTATDPHALIEEIFAATYTGNGSYSDARSQTHLDEYDDRQVTDNSAKQTATAKKDDRVVRMSEPVGETATKKNTDIQPAPTGGVPQRVDDLPIVPSGIALSDVESLARREYRDILSDLVEKCEVGLQAENQSVAGDEQAAADTAEHRIEFRPFKEAEQNITDLGNEVTVRQHNDSAKQYTQKYYYYSNRLLMTHYTIMCAVMFLLGLTMFLTFYVGLGMRMNYDYVLYIFAGLFPILMFIAAVIIFASDPDRKKRININFRFSAVIRVIIMIQVAVVIYCLNLIWGMPVGFSAKYIPSLIIPLVYSLFIPISIGIFATLLKSGKYAVE